MAESYKEQQRALGNCSEQQRIVRSSRELQGAVKSRWLGECQLQESLRELEESDICLSDSES